MTTYMRNTSRANNAFWRTPHLFQLENGESYYDVQDRAIRELKGILEQHEGKPY